MSAIGTLLEVAAAMNTARQAMENMEYVRRLLEEKQVVAEKTVFGAVSDSGSGLERFGGLFGTVVSAAFLLLIGLLNLVVLAGIVRVFASMRRGEYDEAELERQLASRGFFYRFFGRWMKAITKEWQLYPVGVVFGLGFDTAGFVIVGPFLATWLAALLIWRYARIEEKWSQAPSPARPATPHD
jgi:high-affinity nickel permease